MSDDGIDNINTREALEDAHTAMHQTKSSVSFT